MTYIHIPAETPLHPIGTVLEHATLGRVTYWRHAPEVTTDTHVVLAEDDEDQSYYVKASSLVAA